MLLICLFVVASSYILYYKKKNQTGEFKIKIYNYKVDELIRDESPHYFKGSVCFKT